MAEKILRVLNRVDLEDRWKHINPVIMPGEIISSVFPNGTIKFKIGIGSTYTKTPFVNDQFFTKDEMTDMMQIINNIQLGIFSVIQVSEDEPTNSDISIWYELEKENNNGL